MAINLLPREYQDELKYERFSRFLTAFGSSVFLIILINMALLSPLWIFFALEKTELMRQLESTKNSPTFLRVEDVELEIENLNANIVSFNNQKNKLRAAAPAISSILSRRPSGVVIAGINFLSADKNKGQASISISGTAKNRDLLLSFAGSNESNAFFKKVHSPITNLLKESDLDYSLVLDLADEK